MGYDAPNNPQIEGLDEEKRVQSRSLLERDIRAKIEEYFCGSITLEDLFYWLNNPHLLWEMLDEVHDDTPFYTFMKGLQSMYVLYSESREMDEGEISLLLVKLVAKNDEERGGSS